MKKIITVLFIAVMFSVSIPAFAQEEAGTVSDVSATNVTRVDVDDEPADEPAPREHRNSSSGGRSVKFLLMQRISQLEQIISLLQQIRALHGK